MLPTGRGKVRCTIFPRKNTAARRQPTGFGDECMKRNFQSSRRTLSIRRMALLTTTIAGLGAAVSMFSPWISSPDVFGGAAQAQNLTEQVQQLPQRPVGFADIVEKVKPAVISVRVKIDRPSDSSLSDDDLPFPPGCSNISSNASACRTPLEAMK
jgi:hypothetical protein